MSPAFIPHVNVAIVALAAVGLLVNIVPVMIWLERKGSAFIQDRLGPNRAFIPIGPVKLRLMGMIHTLADAVKLMFKEDIIPGTVHRPYYLLAPIVATLGAFHTFAVRHFASPDLFLDVPGLEDLNFQVLHLDAGILWILAIATFSTFAIMLAGWASNNKYALFGALRAGAQMISYELTMALSIVGMVLIVSSLEPQEIVKYQDTWIASWLPLPRWGIFLQPVAFLLFLTCIFAETNRSPFDMAEGESEIVAGYHVEYSSMKFALFFMAEYVNMAVGSMFLVLLFLGGWSIPLVSTETLLAHPSRVGFFMGVAGAVPSLILAVVFLRLDRKRQRQPYFKDLRDREAMFLAVFSAGLGGVLLVLGIVCLTTAGNWAPWLGPTVVAMFQIGFFTLKFMFFLWLFVWVRWTVPRFRYDQVMALGWKAMLPLALLNLLLTALWISGYDALFNS